MFVRSLLLVVIFALSACATGPRTHAIFEPDTDFSVFSTFGFVESLALADGQYRGIEERYLIESIRKELSARGLTESQEAELLVNFHVSQKEKLRTTTTPSSSVGYYSYRGGAGYHGSVGMSFETRTSQYTEGTLNIDVIDAEDRQVIWEGVAVGRMKETPPEDLKGYIGGVVEAVFDQYPVKLPADEES
ncbi:hypothetical protein A3742_15010 [Oleiphilus sp. HI0071]|jgi:hypothetical protein|nr:MULTISPECIES: DUF4136 domain-containing protein [unclassified Oleiphilus]KZY70908.1 hypothetical protein A3737_11095 [Oleiphilus sp. HI0065]KZY78773.1 hypothetical protein A3742_15010 [Oleiphilus sp. HI0071]KZY88571.1 hypothetical protein A3744_24315 [Oleiphilus sp. HI0073]KZZ52274.1 hypothetical protein A3760_10855 [Oleiphilus sp. HI0122]KZZ76594.1 hypothetical protein A3765_09720 [Oleiphilus sp. HI0130]KZZ78705.1 hypothetical protein A3767_12160 [Oleiphilus sp. HI0133]